MGVSHGGEGSRWVDEGRPIRDLARLDAFNAAERRRLERQMRLQTMREAREAHDAEIERTKRERQEWVETAWRTRHSREQGVPWTGQDLADELIDGWRTDDYIGPEPDPVDVVTGNDVPEWRRRDNDQKARLKDLKEMLEEAREDETDTAKRARFSVAVQTAIAGVLVGLHIFPIGPIVAIPLYGAFWLRRRMKRKQFETQLNEIWNEINQTKRLLAADPKGQIVEADAEMIAELHKEHHESMVELYQARVERDSLEEGSRDKRQAAKDFEKISDRVNRIEGKLIPYYMSAENRPWWTEILADARDPELAEEVDDIDTGAIATATRLELRGQRNDVAPDAAIVAQQVQRVTAYRKKEVELLAKFVVTAMLVVPADVPRMELRGDTREERFLDLVRRVIPDAESEERKKLIVDALTELQIGATQIASLSELLQQELEASHEAIEASASLAPAAPSIDLEALGKALDAHSPQPAAPEIRGSVTQEGRSPRAARDTGLGLDLGLGGLI